MLTENVKKANKAKIETVIKALEKRGMKGYYAEDGADALAKILEMIPEGSVVGRGGSATLNEIGVFEALHRGNYTCLEPHNEPDLAKRKQIMNIDGNGNRVAAMIWGPDKVILVAGANKLVRSIDDAEGRIKNDACPPNCIRLNKQTPCAITGKCGDCLSPGNTVCCHTVTTRYNIIEDRIHIILVNDNLGF